MAQALQGRPTLLSRVLRPMERAIYRVSGVDETHAMRWTEYCLALLVFNAVGFAFLFVVQLIQGWLPLIRQDSQCAGGPCFQHGRQLHHQHELAGLFGGSDDELPDADGRAGGAEFRECGDRDCCRVALIRGLVRRSANSLGNFWADRHAPRSMCYCRSAFSPSCSPVRVSCRPSPVTRRRRRWRARATIPLGPAASQIAIKQLGTNGGGFFGVNSAHPFENPTALSNFLEVLAILLLPVALTYTFGAMVGNRQQGCVLFGVMMALFLARLAVRGGRKAPQARSREKRPASASLTARFGRRPPRSLPTVRLTRCTTAFRRSAAWCR